MKFVDASFYLALHLPNDSNRDKAIAMHATLLGEKLVTSQAVIGEVLTVGSMRYSRDKTIAFVGILYQSVSEIYLETPEVVATANEIFSQVENKNIGWVDCYSLATMRHYGIKELLSFDKQLLKLVSNFC